MGAAAVQYLNSVDAVARGLAAQFKVPVGEVPARVAGERSARFLTCALKHEELTGSGTLSAAGKDELGCAVNVSALFAVQPGQHERGNHL